MEPRAFVPFPGRRPFAGATDPVPLHRADSARIDAESGRFDDVSARVETVRSISHESLIHLFWTRRDLGAIRQGRRKPARPVGNQQQKHRALS